MQRVTDRENVADCIGGGKRDGGGTDDRRIEQRHGEDRRRRLADVLVQTGDHAARIGEVAELGAAVKERGRERHHRDGADDHERDPDPQIDLFVLHEARRDALVDHVALLKEQLPRGDRRADDADHEQHDVRELCAVRPAGHDEVVCDDADGRMDRHEHGHEQQAQQAEHDRKAFEPPEIAGADRSHRQHGGRADAYDLRHAEELERERDADELRDDRERIEQEQIDYAESAPEFAEPLEDEACVADARDGAEPQHHLLIHIENRDQERERPKQRRAVVLARLRVGAECAGVVVAHHHDEARAEDREQRAQARHPGAARRHVVMSDRAERPLDVADVRLIEYGATYSGEIGHVCRCGHFASSADDAGYLVRLGPPGVCACALRRTL